MHSPEEYFAEIDVELAGEGRDGQHCFEERTNKRALLLHLFLNAIEDEVKELWHAGEDGDIALLQGPEQIASVERFEIDDAHGNRERQEQVGHLGERMKKRQNAENGVFGADIEDFADAIAFALDIAVREHDSLGIAGSARGVENQGDVASCYGDGLEVARPGGEDFGKLAQTFDELTAVHEDEFDGQVLGGFAGGGETSTIAEQQDGVGINEELADLVGVKSGVERDSGIGGRQNAEVGGGPSGVVGGEESALRSARETLREQPPANGFGHVAELGEGIAFDRCGARGDGRGFTLKFNCDQIREAAGRLREAVVEHARIVEKQLATSN